MKFIKFREENPCGRSNNKRYLNLKDKNNLKEKVLSNETPYTIDKFTINCSLVKRKTERV